MPDTPNGTAANADADCPSEPESDWAIGRVERDRCQAQSDRHMQAEVADPGIALESDGLRSPTDRVHIA